MKSRTVKGIKYYVIDDAQTLLCKLQNKVDAYYDGNECNIDKLEADIEILEKAISCNDITTMDTMISNYSSLFKRYR